MEKKEAIKQAAVKLRVLAEENQKLSDELEKLSSDKEAVEKELRTYKAVCQMAMDGDLDVGEITEKVASMVDKSEDEVQEELQRSQLIHSGIGQIKQANKMDGTGESDPLTDFLLSLGG